MTDGTMAYVLILRAWLKKGVSPSNDHTPNISHASWQRRPLSSKELSGFKSIVSKVAYITNTFVGFPHVSGIGTRIVVTRSGDYIK